MSKVRTIVCCTKYYQNDFFYSAKTLPKKALASDNLALPLIFFNLLLWKSLKISSCEICPADLVKAEKNRVTRAVSTLGRTLTNMFTGPANFRKFHRRKRDKSCSKDPFFPCRKVCVNFRICRVICRLLAIFPWCFLFDWPIFQV